MNGRPVAHVPRLGTSGVPYRFTRFRVAGTIADPQPLFDGGPPRDSASQRQAP
jgi:hypothetical protein